MDVTTNPAHGALPLRPGGLRLPERQNRWGGRHDPHAPPVRHRVDTFLVDERLLPWSLRESVSARGMAHPQVVWSDHIPVRLVLPGFLNVAGQVGGTHPLQPH